MIEKLIEYSIRNRFLVMAVAAALAVWAVYAVLNTPVDAIPDLIKMLDDKSTEARASAAGALGAMGPAAQSAATALLQHLGDPDPGVRQVVAQALTLYARLCNLTRSEATNLECEPVLTRATFPGIVRPRRASSSARRPELATAD